MIFDYIVALLADIKTKEKQLETSTDYDKVTYEFELKALNDQLKNAKFVLGRAFTNEQFTELANGIIPDDISKDMIEQLNAKNEKNKQRFIEYQKGLIESHQKLLDSLLKEDPNCVNPENYIRYNKYKSVENDLNAAKKGLEDLNYNVADIFSVIKPEYINEFLKKLAKNAKNLDNYKDIEKNILSYDVEYKSEKSLTYPVKEKLNKILNNMSASLDTCDMIKKNLDFINEITAVDSNISNNKRYAFAANIDRVVEKKNLSVFLEAVKEQKLEDIAYDDNSSFKKVETKEDLDRVYRDNFKVNYSDNTKLLFALLLKEMQNRDMLPAIVTIKEDGDKFYGFTKFAEARKKFIETVNADEFNEEQFLKDFDNLEKEVKKLDAMSKIIDDKIGTSYDTMATNIDSFRNGEVPRRFKQNLAHNSQINGLYLTLALLKNADFTIDDYIKDPTNVVKKAFDKKFSEYELDNLLKDKNKGEAILELASGKKYPTVDVYGYVRVLEFFNSFETDMEKKKNNAVVLAGMFANFTKKKGVLDGNSYYINNANVSETLQNILLAQKDENNRISYSDCHSRIVKNKEKGSEYVSKLEDSKTGLAITDKPTALDKIANIDNFEETYYEMMGTIKEYHIALKNPNNKVKVQKITMKDLIGAAQEVCAKYLLTHDISALNKEAKANDRGEVVSKNFYNTIINFIKNPSLEETLSVVDTQNMGNTSLEKLVKDRKKLLANKEKEILAFVKTQEAKFINTFKEINKQIDALDKKVDKISKKIGKGNTNDEIEAIGMEQRKLYNELLKVQNDRIEELQKEYEKGMISKYYFESRAEQLQKLQDLDKLPPLFKVDDPEYKNLYKYIDKKDEGLVKEYNNIMEAARNEKMAYLADLVCADNGIRTLKALSSQNEFTVKTQLLEIDENVYKEEFKDYKDFAPTLKEQIVVTEVAESNYDKDLMRLNEPSEDSLEKDKINSKGLIDL